MQVFVLNYMVIFYFQAETETTLSATRLMSLLLYFCHFLDNCQP